MKHMLLIDQYPLWKIFAHCGVPSVDRYMIWKVLSHYAVPSLINAPGRNVRNEEKGQKGCFLKRVLFLVSLYWITRQTYCESRILLLQATAHSL